MTTDDAKITQLPSGGQIQGSDSLVIARAGQTLQGILNGLTAAYTFKGDINIPADFPTLGEVQNGWLYNIIADPDVTDSDSGKTNTEQTFDLGESIAWNGTDWTEVTAFVSQDIWTKISGTPAYVILVDSSAELGADGSRFVKMWLTDLDITNKPYIEGSELSKDTLGLENVENTALSTWAGSTNLNTIGTLPQTVQAVRFVATSASSGNLIPRLTTTQINGIASPVQGEMVYDTDLEVMKIYNSINPSPFIEERWDEAGFNSEGVVQIDGYFDNATVCTFTASTDLVNAVAHPFANDDQVAFKNSTGTLPAEIIQDYEYYIVNKTTDNFQVALTMGGSAVNFTDDGTAGTVYYDLTNSPPSQQGLTLVADEAQWFYYPINSKLAIGDITDWPHNDTAEDDNVWNRDVQSGTFTGDPSNLSDIIIDMNTTTDLTAGMIVTGTGIPDDTIVLSVDSGTQITISQDATADGDDIPLTFYKNRFLENTVDRQAHLIEFQGTFTKSTSPNLELIVLNLYDKDGNKTNEEVNIMRKNDTSGLLCVKVFPVASEDTIGEGYNMSITSTFAATVTITGIKRVSYHKSRKHPLPA